MSEQDTQSTPTTCECEICHKQISTRPGPKAIHMKRHAKEAATETVQESTPMPEEKAEKPVVAPEVKSKAAPKIRSEEDRILYEKALSAQKRYAEAPDIFAAENSSDEFTEIRRVYAPDTFDEIKQNGKKVEVVKKAPYHAYFGLPEAMHSDASKGYVPVFDEKGDIVRGPGDMPLYKIDRRISDARELAIQKESEDRISSTRRNQSKKNTAGIKDVEAIGENDIKEFQATRKRGSLNDLNEGD